MGLLVLSGLGFGFYSSYILVGDGGDVSIVRSILVGEGLLTDHGFLGGIYPKWTFFFIEGGV